MALAKPIPAGHHRITPHLIVKGAAEAIEFYKKAFGAEEVMRMLTPDGKIIHADLKIGDSHVFLVDEMPFGCARSPSSMNGSSVMVHMFTEDADAMFDKAVKAGAKVTMPLMDAFWGDRYGQLTDPFGHMWSVATHKKDMTPDEIRAASAEAFKQMGQGKPQA